MVRDRLTILGLILAGFALRLYYLTASHPFFDEYTTVLAARQILRYGWPILPSGLFYEHGLLATYLAAPFTALFINAPPEQWQAAHWGLMLARWPSLLVGTATIPLIYRLGRRELGSAPVGWLAAGMFALSPEGVVWGGRARMYALATCLALLVVYWGWRGRRSTSYRWAAWLALGAGLLTQFGLLILIPPLLIALLAAAWPDRRPIRPRQAIRRLGTEGLALAGIAALAIFVKRLGRPLGAAELGAGGGNLLGDLFNTTLAYQLSLHLSWTETVEFLAELFGVSHHLWLAVVILIGLPLILLRKPAICPPPSNSPRRGENRLASPPTGGIEGGAFAANTERRQRIPPFALFAGLIFGLITLEMVTLLPPFRRNPRYMVMYLPLFYLVAAYCLWGIGANLLSCHSEAFFAEESPGGRAGFMEILHSLRSFRMTWGWGKRLLRPGLAIGLLALIPLFNYPDLQIALTTPEPAYEEALALVRAEWQPGDCLLTMNTPAAGLYLGRADGFTVQQEAAQFLIAGEAGPVDRWLGAPWVGTVADLNRMLNAHRRCWFVIDTIRLPHYFGGAWQAALKSQMEPVWSADNALVYRTRPDRLPLPAQPETDSAAILGGAIRLKGHSLTAEPSALRLVLFWQTERAIERNYTVFLHLRDEAGATVAQYDGQPLDGRYPTGHWQPGETIIDPIRLELPPELPPGRYRLLAGMYDLDTLARLPVQDDASGENAILLQEINLP